MKPVSREPIARRWTFGQALMEWDPLVRLYESRLWRRSVVFHALLGLSFDEEYSLITSALRLSGARRVLDLACGPGIYARRFAGARPAAVVVGMDLSRPMLRYAARAAGRMGLDNLFLFRGDATELPFAADVFDAVNCCGALHLFADVQRALTEMRRVLRDGGYLTLAVFRRGDGALAQVRARIRQRLYGIDSFSPTDLAARLRASGFKPHPPLHAAGLWLILSAQKEMDRTVP